MGSARYAQKWQQFVRRTHIAVLQSFAIVVIKDKMIHWLNGQSSQLDLDLDLDLDPLQLDVGPSS